MAEQTHRFKAKIAGKTYTIVGKATDAHMRAVTQVLNEQYDQLKNQLPASVTKEDAAVLMAFNAISDQLKLQAQLDARATSTDATDESATPSATDSTNSETGD
ncbi:cell division protein ZapA [Levilactobacillus namurensis]|uniref:cell division protein ZapA n=1 Tax=Levilactobacillus namurensis TaxID=380393 RepID=UPI0004633087|nr:cell division protein ZapA [Levilactobacillus namurensis]